MFPFPIPDGLLDPSATDEDINILIGENGCGKSTLLSKIADYFVSGNVSVIAIANSIYDKFSNSKKLNVQRAATGKYIAVKTLKNAMVNLANDDLKRLRNVADTLTYVGFDPVIGFQLEGIDKNFRDKVIDAPLQDDVKEDLLYFLNRFTNEEFGRKDIIRLYLGSNSFKDLKDSYLVTLFRYEKELKSLRLIKKINVFLRKRGEDIPLLKASSGEITLVSSLIYITSSIQSKSVILIDEPENSLHPKWQTEYVKRLSELFYYYQPKIIVATHAPLILSGAEVNSNNIRVYKGSEGSFNLHVNTSMNVEEIYQDFFDVTTPENRYISEEVINKLNLLSDKKMNENDFLDFINDLKDASYDEKQKQALDGIVDLSKEILKEIN